MNEPWWNKYLGIKFEEKGRSMTAGDCWNIPYQIYKNERNIPLPSYAELYDNTEERDVLGILIENERKSKWIIPEDSPKEFDVIILRMRGVPMHVGIVTKPGFMLHCAKGINTVHVPYTSNLWKNNVMGFARWAI